MKWHFSTVTVCILGALGQPVAANPISDVLSRVLQTDNDTPMHFPQRNTYAGGIQDCTESDSCGSEESSDDQKPDNQAVCGGGNLPGQFCSDQPLTPSEQSLIAHGVTLADAIKCNAAFTLAGIFRSDSDLSAGDGALLNTIPDSVGGQNRDLWDIIWHLAPSVQRAPAANKEGWFIRARDTPIQDAVPIYRANIKLLVSDYHYCIKKGINPS